jgi:hypothetical protein
MRPPYCKKFEIHWTSFANTYPELKDIDCFVTGYHFYFPTWFSPQTFPTILRVIGSPEALGESHGFKLENVHYSENGRFHAEFTKGLAPVATLDFFPELGQLMSYLDQRPCSYQKAAYSLRLCTMLQEANCSFPRDVRCGSSVQTPQDRSEILEFCLRAHLPLSKISTPSQFEPIHSQEWSSLGIQDIISSNLRSSYFLEDLRDSGYLSPELSKNLEGMCFALDWWEDLPLNHREFWNEFLENQIGQSEEFLRPEDLKRTFLSLFLDPCQGLDTESKPAWVAKVQSLGAWWSETLAGEGLTPAQMADWIERFGPHYRAAFLLSALRSMPHLKRQSFAFQRLRTLIEEILISTPESSSRIW